MRYVLIDRGANIIDSVDLASDVGISGAKTFFIGRKQIDSKEFDNLWRVMSEEKYKIQCNLSLKNRQSSWWKEDRAIIDDELKW